MDLLQIATRIALVEPTAAANPAVAQAVANLVKEAVKPLLSKLNPDFGYDALSSGLRGMSEDSISFPARPADFDAANLNGTILGPAATAPRPPARASPPSRRA